MDEEYDSGNSEQIVMESVMKKIKIGILTRRAGFNHGSSLQAYAMAKFISNAGFDCSIIDYDEYSGHPRWKIRPFIEDFQWILCKHLPSLFSPDKRKYLSIRNKQYKKFNQFDNQFLPLTNERCNNSKLLRSVCRDFDILICGSDQIWNPLLYDPVYLFGFLKDEKKRTVAYAPSFGVSDIKLIGNKERKLIRRIDCLSCREEKGAEFVEEITGKPCPIVLDPTLMVDFKDWETLATSVFDVESKPYILCYFLGQDVHQDRISSLAQRFDCKILNIQMFNRMNSLYSDREITDLGPIEFLNLIMKAEWVCTDSFHATIFAYLFKRKVSVFERFKSCDEENQNSRIHTLLKVLGIESVLSHGNNINSDFPIDYSKTNNTLKAWKDKSMRYLHHSLSL